MLKLWKVAALILLGISALLSNFLLFQPIYQGKSDRTRLISKELGGWRFVQSDLPSEAEVRILETSDIIKWSYSNGKHSVHLVVAYIPRSNRKAAHSQETCLRGSGANVSNLVARNLKKSPVSAKTIKIKSGSRQSLVYYWYKIRRKYTATFLTSSLKLFLGGLSGKNHGASLIRIMTPILNEEPDSAVHNRLEDFTQHLIPELEKHLP